MKPVTHDAFAGPLQALGLTNANPTTKWSRPEADADIVLPRVQLREGLVVGLSDLQAKTPI